MSIFGIDLGAPLESADRIEPFQNSRSLFPLSFAQERLWFLEQLHFEGSSYNVPLALCLSGPLDLGALERGMNEIRRRHEALRTTFAIANGRPIQVISAWEDIRVPVKDISGMPEEDREAEAERLAGEEAVRPFDLSQGPLLRTSLLRLGNEDHVLLLTMHHIISDGWSIGVFFRELEALYGAYSQGRPSPLPELGIQYKDFAVWQRQWLQGEVLESQLSYWKRQLGGGLPMLDLPTDYPKSAVPNFQGASESITLPESMCRSLKRLSQQEGCTFFMTLLAAFQVLLHRYTGQEDIVVGSPIANRNRAETEDLIGFFVNTLVLRTDLKGNPTFRELMGKVREVALGAYAHQDIPFEKLVEELQPDRNLSHSPLFQVMIVFDQVKEEEGEMRGLSTSPLVTETETTLFDLMLSIEEYATELGVSMEYRTDLFRAETIARMLVHFRTLLEGIVDDPDCRVSRLPILTEEERQQLVVWNDTHQDYGPAVCVHEMFEAQAARTPDATAVIFEAESLTYGELDRRSNQLARRLQSLGVGPEVLVGICVERSLEMLIGILGILKAGGAYVPLDPMYPKERIEFMVRDTRAPVVLTQERLAGQLPQGEAQLMFLDADWPAISQQSTEKPDTQVAPTNLAYVIYTSGSTGTPKGVMMPHAGLFNRLMWMQEKYSLNERDRMLQLAPYSFDISVCEIFLPLVAGSIVILTPPGMHGDPTYMVRAVLKEEISILSFVPSSLQSFLNEPDVETCKSLRSVICSGEAMPRELERRFCRRLGDYLHNLYGPTEACVYATFWPCQRNHGWNSVPIGRPLANVEIYILDRYLNPVPVGISGELYIGGTGLARGYLNQPELTQGRFIPHPFRNSEGAKVYRTGDLARYLPDGNVEFLGRYDDQVKVRGFRIELGEIQAALAQYPKIKQVAVLFREDTPGRKSLTAYIVFHPGQSATIPEIRNFLMTKLPEYMVPSTIVGLEALPLTASGKVDRKALPAARQDRLQIGNAFVPPRSQLEKLLEQVWGQLLGMEKIGIYDNFFELGGHSLLATQVVSRLRDALQATVPLKYIFEAPTIAQLADRIEAPSTAESPGA